MTLEQAIDQARTIAMARSHVAYIHVDPAMEYNFRFDRPIEQSWPDDTRYRTVRWIAVDGTVFHYKAAPLGQSDKPSHVATVLP